MRSAQTAGSVGGGSEASAVADPRESTVAGAVGTLRPPCEPASSPPRRARVSCSLSPDVSLGGRRSRTGRDQRPEAVRWARRDGNDGEGTVAQCRGQDAALRCTAGTVAAPMADSEQSERPVNTTGRPKPSFTEGACASDRKGTSASRARAAGNERQQAGAAAQGPPTCFQLNGAGARGLGNKTVSKSDARSCHLRCWAFSNDRPRRPCSRQVQTSLTLRTALRVPCPQLPALVGVLIPAFAGTCGSPCTSSGRW